MIPLGRAKREVNIWEESLYQRLGHACPPGQLENSRWAPQIPLEKGPLCKPRFSCNTNVFFYKKAVYKIYSMVLDNPMKRVPHFNNFRAFLAASTPLTRDRRFWLKEKAIISRSFPCELWSNSLLFLLLVCKVLILLNKQEYG